MQYKCPQCGHLSTEAGNCPMCNVPMQPVEGGAAPGPTTPVAPEAAPAGPAPEAPEEESPTPPMPPPPPAA
ncbi:MAG: hypothetical protein HYY99_00325 [Candidatus Colwellbacteria bacterium]|nr:hypothetical protein [Candidatus Colwellbacteria bacterium]